MNKKADLKRWVFNFDSHRGKNPLLYFQALMSFRERAEGMNVQLSEDVQAWGRCEEVRRCGWLYDPQVAEASGVHF